MNKSSESSVGLLRDCVAALAVSAGNDEGLVAVLDLLQGGTGARSVELAMGTDGAGRRWTTQGVVDGEARPDSVGVTRLPIDIGGVTVGELVIEHDAALDDESQGTLEAVADLLGVAMNRDARLGELERELHDSVREIANQRAFIECIVDSLPVSLYVVDRDYRIQAWNHKRELGLQGVSRRDAIGRTIFEVLHRQPPALLKQEFDEAFDSGDIQQFQMESNAFGDTRSYRISKIPMRMGGLRVTHVITIAEDITDWKAAIDRTAQSEKLAALGQLAAGVMHEINNPLATIAACAESLALQRELVMPMPSSPDSTSADELLRIIDLEVQRCKRIANGLLDFSRPKPASRETLQLNTVVEQGLFLLRHHPKYKRVRLVPELDGGASLFVEGDSDGLVQVLMALVINAMDATPEGGRVTVRTRFEPGATRAGADRRGHALLEVSDEGPGIPPAFHAKLFEPFFSTKAQGQGTGLGLSICYGIVTDHGGQLELVPSEGGALFRVTLPESPMRARGGGLQRAAGASATST
jgi:two-component system NtrC family sensor kinase